MISLSTKTVTVVLPNYNYADYIVSRIDEIINQSYPISEIIILDDASTDDSITIIKKKCAEVKKSHPELNIKLLVNKENSGNVFSQWQKGIEHATGDYIWIAELDDITRRTFLETAMRGFQDKKVVLSYTNSRFIDDDGKMVLKDNLRKIKDAFRKNLLVYNIIPNVSAVVFKNQPCLIGFLEEAKQYRLSGDWFFYIKISETGKIAYSRRILNLHRLHKRSVTSNTDFKERFNEIAAIHRYVNESINPSAKVKEEIVKIEKTLMRNWKIKG